MIYKTLFTFILIATLGLVVWSSFSFYRPEKPNAVKTSSLPDAIMEDVTALILDKQGKPSMKVITPQLIHYTENDTTHFSTPQLVLYRKSPQPWYISAKFAKATEGIENVHFQEDVTVHHAADQRNPATLIKTTTLMVRPNKQTAETPEFITLVQPNMTVKAIGMYADMSTGEIKLLSQARGEYEPNS
jgi:lipopolysaccharide export system protein LptC